MTVPDDLPSTPDSEGDGGENEFDFSSFGVDPTPEPTDNDGQPEDGGPESGGGDNPAWSSILAEVPEVFHEKIKPLLKEWDRGVNSRFQKIHQEYQPLKAFEEFQKQNLTIDEIKQAIAASQHLERDPLGVYNRLREYLVQTGALQAEQENTDDEEFEDEDSDDPTSQKLKQLEAQQRQLLESLETQRREDEQKAAQREMDRRIDSELSDLETKHGTMSDAIKEEILNRALAKAQRENRYVPLDEAFNDMLAFMAKVRKSKPTPPKLPSGGGVPPSAEPPALDDPKSRKAAAAEFVKNMLQNQQQQG